MNRNAVTYSALLRCGTGPSRTHACSGGFRRLSHGTLLCFCNQELPRPLNRGLSTSLLGAGHRCPEGGSATSHERQRELLGGCPHLHPPHRVPSPALLPQSSRPAAALVLHLRLTRAAHMAPTARGAGRWGAGRCRHSGQRYRPL